MFTGDLLAALSSVDSDYWHDHSDHWFDISQAIETVTPALSQLDEEGELTRFQNVFGDAAAP